MWNTNNDILYIYIVTLPSFDASESGSPGNSGILHALGRGHAGPCQRGPSGRKQSRARRESREAHSSGAASNASNFEPLTLVNRK